MYKGKNDIKIKIFYNHDTYGITPKGGTYVSTEYASDKAAEFINRLDVEILDIKYNSESICLIYRKLKNMKAN